MKKFIVFIFIVFIAFPAFALLTIKGKIIDSSTKKPLDFVNVALLLPNSEVPKAGMTTDGNGNFLLPQVPKGKYTLRVSFVGYNTINIPLNVDESELNLGIIKLIEDSKTLSEVEVLGQGSQMKFDIDKKVFTVDQNLSSAGGSASDVLQNIPSVEVDGEGNVSLRNNSSVEVWINGKPSGLNADNRAQVLQQMPAESIDKIEVMTNPSAKFKPEGTSGIINIVLKKNRKAGYFGSVSAGGISVQGAKPTGTLGVSVNYSSSKLDAYVNMGYRSMNFKGYAENDRYALNGTDTVSVLSQVTDPMKRGYGGIFGRAGLDFHLNDKHTISLSGFGMFGTGYSSSTTVYSLDNRLNPALNRAYNRISSGDGSRESVSVNLDYKFDIDDLGSNLMASLSYSPHSRTSNDIIKQTENNLVANHFSQNNVGNNNEYEFKLDYTKKFSENQRLELGWNSSIENRSSPATAYDILANTNLESYYNDFVQSEFVHAAYATYGSRYGNLSFQGGLRAEYFETKWDNNYYENGIKQTVSGSPNGKVRLFPSAFVSYSLPEKNELQLNITRRIRRPHGREMNPFRNYSDSSNISYGNPDLLPELSSAFELNYIKNWDNHTFSASTYYRYTNNVMQNVQYFNNGTMENTTMNVTKSSNLGVELVAKNRFFKIVNLTSTLNLYYNKIDSSSYTSIYDRSIVTAVPEKELFSWNVRSMANIILGKNTFLQLSGDYSAPRLVAQGKETASYAFDMGVRQTFLNRNLSLNLMVRDIFNTRNRSTITNGDGFYQKSSSYFMGRMIGLTATYNFGNMKPKQSQIKKESNDMGMDGGMD